METEAWVIGNQLVSPSFYGIVYMAGQENNDFVEIMVMKLQFLCRNVC